ncbi:MAG: hypothetical protein HY013_13720 [Candidatus Solibacter usitatus]|nr:hypothetical protein [Candidatus Solibacter usitatus]
MSDPREQRFDALLKSYREACPDPEPSVNFMPHLWAKIERAQNASLGFRRIARGFVTAAAAVSLMMGALAVIPNSATSPIYTATYVETLADNHFLEHVEYSEAPQSDPSDAFDDADLI